MNAGIDKGFFIGSIPPDVGQSLLLHVLDYLFFPLDNHEGDTLVPELLTDVASDAPITADDIVVLKPVDGFFQFLPPHEPSDFPFYNDPSQQRYEIGYYAHAADNQGNGKKPPGSG